MDKEKNLTQMNFTTTANAAPIIMRKCVGNTTYHVSLYFKENAKEDMNDKINRLIKMECA
ncbi:MAG: transposon-encoded TnpW family protein [Oscillospiraceae bacterium]|nr:transposon-encoded TnpW family protein [Oscillospiraceae bacterium]